MKERPIIFSAPMVRALLDGTKTQTRRALKTQPIDVIPMEGDKVGMEWVGRMQENPPRGVIFACKFGRPGDRLWVREPHCFLDILKSALSQFPLAGGGFGPDVWNLCVEYSDGTENDTFSVEGDKPKQTRERGETRWRSPIHMPRWASRILLELTAVRVDRLQDISEADAVAEGVTTIWPDGPRRDKGPNHYTIKIGDVSYNAPTAVGAYSMLWEQINGPGSWDANPWVWCLIFKRVKP